jgi:DNA-binding CsgD family transcriptional regulator
VIVVDDASELAAELASLVRHVQRFAGQNGPPSVEVIASSPRPAPGSPVIERRKRTTDRRQGARLPAADADSASATPDAQQTVPGSSAADTRHPCTDREREIVVLLRRGLTNKQIAQQLGIMEETVKKHLQHIYDKLGVRRRALVMLGQVGTPVYLDGEPAFP